MKLELGKQYKVTIKLNNGFVLRNELRFIKVTQKGYNFLNEKTNKCVFKQHFYPISKYSKNYKGEMTFFIPKKLTVI
jgi:hypothetical protein